MEDDVAELQSQQNDVTKHIISNAEQNNESSARSPEITGDFPKISSAI